MEIRVDGVVFVAVEGVAGFVWAWRVDHAVDEALAYDGRAEHDADEFVDLGDDL